MQIERNVNITPSVLKYLILLVFIALTACSVSSKKSEVVSEPSQTTAVESSDSLQAQANTETADSKKSAADSDTSGIKEEEKESTDAEVIEPKVTESNITLEPIPQAVPESQAERKADTATEPMQSATKPEDELKMAKISPAVPAPSKPDTGVPAPAGADHFVITVAEKDQRHPKFGEGHKMGFLINGVPGGSVVVERGKTYSFDVATNPKHDVYLSTKPIGWGASAWSDGVEGAYIYEGTITFTAPENAPPVLYYSCRNHPYMGGEIHIINPGEKIDLAKLTQAGGTVASVGKSVEKSSKPQVSVAMVNQKLMFAEMLVNSAASNRVKASANGEAKQLQAKGENLVVQAKDQLKAGNNQDAYAKAEESLALLKKAARLVPSEAEVTVLKENYNELLHSVHNFEQSHKESYQRMLKAGGEKSAVDYDKKQVALLMKDAEGLAKKDDYVNANKKLENAQHIITSAIQKMLNSQTIVYDLNFATPKEEYEYELKRFGGYEELIPIAVEQKKPNEGTKKLMNSFVEKGHKMRSIAMDTAKAGDYPRAIAMMQDATKEIRRALRMVGVMQ